MSKKKKILIIIFVIIVIGAITIFCLAMNGKKKMDFVLDAGECMYEFNERIGSSDNLYIKTTDNSDYFEDYFFENDYKSVQLKNGVKITRVFTPTQTIEYKEVNDDKIMCILPVEEDEYEEAEEDYSSEETGHNEDSYKKSILDNISDFFSMISYGLHTKITEEVEDNKECYVITESEGNGNKYIQYLDKETKIVLKTVAIERGGEFKETITYEYSFGTVTADDVKELDPSEYTLLSEDEFKDYEFSNLN